MYSQTLIPTLAACVVVLSACSSRGAGNGSAKTGGAATVAAIDAAAIGTVSADTLAIDSTDVCLAIADTTAVDTTGIVTPETGTAAATGRKMVTMQNLYYPFEEKLKGERTSFLLDSIPELKHAKVNEKWIYTPDSLKFDMIVHLYLDRGYPTLAIRKQLLCRIDKILTDYVREDTEFGKDILNATPRPSENPSITEFVNAWKEILRKLTALNGCTAETECFHEISNALSFVLCHKVFEDASWVTYLIEHGSSGHAGCGCRNTMDYLTFNKATGHRLTKKEIVNDSNFASINAAIYKEYLIATGREATEDGAEFNYVKAANGAALLSEGLLFYYHTYNIGANGHSQGNYILDRSLWGK